MREDIKAIIENTSSWKENFAEDPIETKEVVRVEKAIADWRKRDPYQADLYAAYIIAKDEGDDKTADAVMVLINEYEKDV